MPKALYIDPNETLRPKDHELKLPSIPVMKYKKTVKEEVKEGNFTKEDLLRIYRDMSYIREVRDHAQSGQDHGRLQWGRLQ